MEELYIHQREAVDKIHDQTLVVGGVGAGKSRVGLCWYFEANGGIYRGRTFREIGPNAKDLYIITTARKRDTLEWGGELCVFLLQIGENSRVYGDKGPTITVDSWQNLKKYVDVKDAYFIFDEDHLTNPTGAWTKAFYKIAKNNHWIVLTATPADTLIEYAPILIARGYYRNITDFRTQHCRYMGWDKYMTKPTYINTVRLNRLLNKTIVRIKYRHKVDVENVDIWCNYNRDDYRKVQRDRINPFTEEYEPIENVSQLFYLLRLVCNTSTDRQLRLLEILENVPRAIIFYNFDPELEILRNLPYIPGTEVAELNGHKHEDVPTSDRFVYLVQYASGSEAWNYTKTDTIIFWSQTYSYKQLTQAKGRIDRLNTPYDKLYYYHLKSKSGIDLAINKALKAKRKFNEKRYSQEIGLVFDDGNKT